MQIKWTFYWILSWCGYIKWLMKVGKTEVYWLGARSGRPLRRLARCDSTLPKKKEGKVRKLVERSKYLRQCAFEIQNFLLYYGVNFTYPESLSLPSVWMRWCCLSSKAWDGVSGPTLVAELPESVVPVSTERSETFFTPASQSSLHWMEQ